MFELHLLLCCSESRYCYGTAGWLPWFLKEVHALAGGADPGGTDEELAGGFAEVRTEDEFLNLIPAKYRTVNGQPNCINATHQNKTVLQTKSTISLIMDIQVNGEHSRNRANDILSNLLFTVLYGRPCKSTSFV